MYQKPELGRLGKAQEVILGNVPVGGDMDGNWFIPDMEFAANVDAAEDEPIA